MTAIIQLRLLMATLALCLTAASAKHLMDEKAIESPLPANMSDQSGVAALKRLGNRVQLGECLDPDDPNCRHPSTNHAQTSVAEASNAARQARSTLDLSISLGLFLAQGQAYFTLMQPLLAAALTIAPFFTPEQVTLFNDIITTAQAFHFTTLPNVVAMLATNPTLTPVQIQEVQTALQEGVTLNTNMQLIIEVMATQFLAIGGMSSNNGDYYETMLEIFSDPNNQPAPSECQTLALQESLNAIIGLVSPPSTESTTASQMTTSASPCHTTISTTITTSTTPHPTHHPTHHSTHRPTHHSTRRPYRPRPTHSRPRPTHQYTTDSSPPYGGSHYNHQHQHQRPTTYEKYLAFARIQGMIVEMQTLLPMLFELSAAMGRSDAQPMYSNEQLLVRHARQAEFDARLRTMSAQEQEEMDSKLEVAQGQLRKLVTDESQLKQYLSKTNGSQPIYMVFLNKMADIVDPFR